MDATNDRKRSREQEEDGHGEDRKAVGGHMCDASPTSSMSGCDSVSGYAADDDHSSDGSNNGKRAPRAWSSLLMIDAIRHQPATSAAGKIKLSSSAPAYEGKERRLVRMSHKRMAFYSSIPSHETLQSGLSNVSSASNVAASGTGSRRKRMHKSSLTGSNFQPRCHRQRYGNGNMERNGSGLLNSNSERSNMSFVASGPMMTPQDECQPVSQAQDATVQAKVQAASLFESYLQIIMVRNSSSKHE